MKRREKNPVFYLCVPLNCQRSYCWEREQVEFYLPGSHVNIKGLRGLGGGWVGGIMWVETKPGWAPARKAGCSQGVGRFWWWLSGQEEEEVTALAWKDAVEKPEPTFLAKPILSCPLPSALLGVLSMCVSVSLFKFLLFMRTQSCWAYPNYLILARFHLWRPSLFPNKVTFTGTGG